MLLSHAACACAESGYTVRYVFDGDTVKLQSRQSGEQFKLRIAHIDAPERNQPYGNKSRRALLKLCQGQHIDVEATLTGFDQYGRRIGSLYCNDTDAGMYLIQQGLAWHPSRYSRNAQARAAAAQAQSRKIGLWKAAHPTPPWLWRKTHAQPHTVQ